MATFVLGLAVLSGPNVNGQRTEVEQREHGRVSLCPKFPWKEVLVKIQVDKKCRCYCYGT